MKTEYTVEVYRVDKRYKDGLRLYSKFDFIQQEHDELDRLTNAMFGDKKVNPLCGGDGKFVWKIFETYVTKKNLISGEEFRERYDTPYYCSPSSETYWSS